MLPTNTPLRICWPIHVYWTIWNLLSLTCCTLGSCCASRVGVKENLPSGVLKSFTLPRPASMSSRPVLPPARWMASEGMSTPEDTRAEDLLGVQHDFFISARDFSFARAFLVQ